jgi:hypothetical protein
MVYTCPIYSSKLKYSTKPQHLPLRLLSTLFVSSSTLLGIGTFARGVNRKGMPPVTHRIVQRLAMLRNSLIPEHHCSWLISHPTTEVVVSIDVIEQELQQIVRLIIIESYNTLRIRRVHKQSYSALSQAEPSQQDEPILSLVFSRHSCPHYCGPPCSLCWQSYAQPTSPPTLPKLRREFWNARTVLQITASPSTPDRLSSIAKKVSPGGCDSGD